jgi:hypothetical protein
MGCCDDDGDRGCCAYPHGRLSIWSMILAICTYIVTSLSFFGCFYVEVDGAFDLDLGISSGQFDSSRGVGLFSYEDPFRDDYTCVSYSQNQIERMDGAFRTARVFGYIANIFIGIAALMLILMGCLRFNNAAIKGIGSMLLAGAIFSLLTFTFFASDTCSNDCDFFAGAGLAVVGTFSAFATALLVFKIPSTSQSNSLSEPQSGHQHAPFAPGTQTVTETTLLDGTKKVVRTTVNADGSRTIEETVER